MKPYVPIIQAAAPVYDEHGRLFGVIVIDRQLNGLCDDLAAQMPANRSLYICDEEGTFILHPDSSRTIGQLRPNDHHAPVDLPVLINFLSEQEVAQQSAVQDLGDGHPTAVGMFKLAYDPENQQRFLAFALTGPKSDIEGASIEARNHSILAGMAVLLPALVIAFVLSRALARPLQQIAAATRDFARGEKNIALPLGASDEAGVVARSLQNMIEQVRNRTDALELEINERQRAEGMVREQAARISAIVNGVIDAIITIDPRGTIETVNPAAERMFGYAAAELLGKNVKMLMPQPYRGEHDQYLKNYVDSGVRKIIGIGREVVGVRKDGSEFPIDLAVTEVKIEGRQVFTGVVRDITDRKRSEALHHHHSTERKH
jgi:PAS domain S-box-containing protein